MHVRRAHTRHVPVLVAGLLLPLALAVTAYPAAGQATRGGVAIVGGGSIHDDLTPGLETPTEFETGWVAGLQAERWLGGGRSGLRFNTLFTQRQLDGAPGDYNVYMAGVDLLLRLLPVRPARVAAPYLALGAGATHYAPVGGSPTFAGGAYGNNPVRAHLLAGFGLDLTPGNPVGLRLEVADKIVLPSVGRSPEASGLPMVHNLVLTTGLQLRWGRLARPAAIAAAEPAATPAAPEARNEARDDSPLYTVQVATFVEWATARRWRERLLDRDLPVWLLDTEIQGERVSRVRVGALPSESEAQSLAAALERDYGWPVQVDRVAPDEPFPSDAVAGTRAFLHAN